ncbi:DMT(drug/metabolite transporter) superfamily permease [Pseudomonas aeruginosa]|uniref:DMT family transporter n=1 Tax=Pseudomonas aeruginosa TaxID=287 RepID=UPI000B2AF5BB|nr:DMT family transporter [Pseudomonas aeruginosa]SQC94931.1 DMT(drug/metabolite transporter) superfamily permease [Pseudomonas aeruginosa]HBO4409548.1 DMT family transporter [Pseudomonas aeruginosa]HCJ0865889.1 DMT family transporter [Pseudomonas aeruginosa]HCJ2985035.1 DMT family transporter [Pseudomonas aeruginosa]HEJ1607520.1 DMT family transporter [Pseudomonas aeruginosa]
MHNGSKVRSYCITRTLESLCSNKGNIMISRRHSDVGGELACNESGLSHITPIWFSTLRFALGAAYLFLVRAVTGEHIVPKRHEVPLTASVGLLQMITFTVLGAVAMTHVNAGRSAILASPLWVLPIAVLLLHEGQSRKELMGTFMGVLILFNPLSLDWSNQPLVQANLIPLAASLCWALSMLHLPYSKNSWLTNWPRGRWHQLVFHFQLFPGGWRVHTPVMARARSGKSCCLWPPGNRFLLLRG